MTHILHIGPTLTLARRMPIRWDVEARGVVRSGPLSRARLALQIRQDLWRLLQRLRGFAPVVEVTASEGGYALRAGGQLVRRFPKGHVEGLITDLLGSRAHQERWCRFAALRRAASC